ncbi:hypothetical protein I4U23_002863 [Adineta vaga]|nr:hypothetical protein I4U23_002863 [Adineta vaga]
MVLKHRTSGLVVGCLVVIISIIHLGVGIGITARYRKYNDVFRLSVGLSAYNIVIGIFGLAVGAATVFAVKKERVSLSRPLAIMALVLGIMAIASFITGLVINSTSIDFIKDRLTFRMSTYDENEDSIDIMDNVQTNYDCCGVNLWLDWSSQSLGVTNGVGVGVGRRRRRRHNAQVSRTLTPLSQIFPLRQKRQIVTGSSNIYNLPTTFSFKLPTSCCKSGAFTDSNSLGGYCLYNTSTSVTSFNVAGCLPPVANTSVSQVTGIVVINTCLSILALVLLPLLLIMFTRDPNSDTSDDKQQQANETNQQQQQQQQQQMSMEYQPQPTMQYRQPSQQLQYHDPNQGYYMNNNAPAYYYNNNPPTYSTYQ